MTIQAERWKTSLQVTRGVGAAGFIVARWLLSVCNVPPLCGWLAGSSAVLGGMYVVAFLSSVGLRSSVLSRSAARLLTLTCVLNLAGVVLDLTAPQLFWRRTAFVNGLDALSWVWVLAASLVAARWLWGGLPAAADATTRRFAPRHLVLTALIAPALGLQVWAIVRDTPTAWPFIPYALYSTAHGTPIRAVHYRVHGTTVQTPNVEFEITAEALEMRWFPYHTQFIPQLFHTPSLVLDEFQRRLEDSDLPPLQHVVAEREAFELDDAKLGSVVERRAIPLEPVSPDRNASEREEPRPDLAADVRLR